MTIFQTQNVPILERGEKAIVFRLSTPVLTSIIVPHQQDPKSVHVSWATYFNGLDKGLPSSQAFTPPPGYSGGLLGTTSVPAPADGAPAMALSAGNDQVTDHLKVCSLLTHDVIDHSSRDLLNMILTIGSTSRSSLPSPRTPCCQA